MKYVIALLLIAFSISSCSKELDIDIKENNSSKYPFTKGSIITLKSGVKVKELDGKMFLGDILLSEKDYRLLEETGSIFREEEYKDSSYVGEKGIPVSPTLGISALPYELRAFGLSPSLGKFWTMLRYTFASNLQDWQKKSIVNAMKYMESVTNVRFYDANNEPKIDPNYGFEYPYVEFTYSESINSSYVGRKGGKQILLLSDYNQGTIVHEICHALGMYHEQSRHDRDSHIKVLYENIEPGEEYNFSKVSNNYYYVGKFDFESVMIYGSLAFSKNNKPTITKLDGSTFTGHKNVLSESDRSFLNRFYLPYKGTKDICLELDSVVYNAYNEKLSKSVRESLEAIINQGRCYRSYPRNK